MASNVGLMRLKKELKMLYEDYPLIDDEGGWCCEQAAFMQYRRQHPLSFAEHAAVVPFRHFNVYPRRAWGENDFVRHFAGDLARGHCILNAPFPTRIGAPAWRSTNRAVCRL